MPDEIMIMDLSGLGGLAARKVGVFSDHEDRTLIYLGADNQFADGVVNPICRLGYLSPSIAEIVNVSAGTSIGLVSSTLVDSASTSLYFLERGAYTSGNPANIWMRIRTNGGTYNFKKVNTTNHGGSIGTDMEWYTTDDVKTMFYAFQCETSAGIGIFKPTTGVWYNNWSYELAAGTSIEFGLNDLKMVVADNSFMYILDGSAIHKVDGGSTGGANGTIYSNVILFPSTFRLIDAVDSNGYLWVALLGTSEPDSNYLSTINTFSDRRAGVYVWDRASTVANSVDFITIDGIRTIKSLHLFQGGIICFTVSTTNKTQLRKYNGKEFEVIEELPRNSYPPYHDSVDSSGDRLIWQGNDGILWSWGKITPSGGNILLKIGDMTKESVIGTGNIFASAGAIAGQHYLYENYIISLYNNSHPLLTKYAPQGQDIEGTGIWQTVAESNFFSLVKRFPKLSTLKEMTLFFPAQPLAGSIVDTLEMLQCDVYVNNASTTIKTMSLTGKDRRLGYKRIPISKADVNCFQIGLRWKENLTNRYQITPSHAEIIYEPKIKKK